jgi:hypothetical protein
MSRKSIVKSFQIFDTVDISTNQTSSAVNVLKLDQASISISWSGTAPVGVITVEAKNGTNDSFYELDFGTTIPVSGNSGNHQIILSEMPFEEIRVIYTSTSGTGSLDAIYTAKVLGA